MKILKYRLFMLKEQLINKDVPVTLSKENAISQIQKTIDEILSAGSQLEELDDYEFEDILDSIEEKPSPETYKRYIVNSFKMIRDKEIRKIYLDLLNIVKSLFLNGLDAMEINDNPEIKSKSDELYDMMTRKLKLNREELDSLTNKFFAGAKKYNDSQNPKITDDDPFGEESDITEEERLRKSFENIRF